MKSGRKVGNIEIDSGEDLFFIFREHLGFGSKIGKSEIKPK